MTIATIDPSTGQLLDAYEETTPEQLDALLDEALSAYHGWRELAPDQRAEGLGRLARELRKRKEELAMLATLEMGKPLLESRAEVEKCAWACEWYAEHAPKLLEAEVLEIEALRSQVIAQPLGVVFAIMPWNFPYWQVVRAIAPALAAGNVVLLKHAPSTTGCGLALADVADSAGLPSAVLSVLVVGTERTAEVSARVIEDDRVAAVTLTGSTKAGKSVAAVAGGALKKTVMELGGSDPFVVLSDADLDAAAAWAARSRFQNTGQSCIAAKRIVVEDSVAEVFVGKLLDQVGDLRLGQPTEPGVTVGPLAERTYVTQSRARSASPLPRVHASWLAVTSRKDRAFSTSRLSSITSDQACRCSKRRYSAPPSPCCERVTVQRRSGSPTTALMAWAAPYGPLTSSAERHSPSAFKRGIRP